MIWDGILRDLVIKRREIGNEILARFDAVLGAELEVTLKPLIPEVPIESKKKYKKRAQKKPVAKKMEGENTYQCRDCGEQFYSRTPVDLVFCVKCEGTHIEWLDKPTARVGIRRWTSEDDERIVRLKDQGVATSEIAKQFDVSVGSIHQRVHQIKIRK